MSLFISGDSIFIPILIFSDEENIRIAENFFAHNGMVSNYFATTLVCVLWLSAGIVMAVNIRKFKKKEEENSDTDEV